jgi:outer membrane receptor protein involved in Fe transport
VNAATIIDARAEYRLNRLTLFFFAHNLFDKFAFIESDGFSAVPEDPRKLAAGIEARF